MTAHFERHNYFNLGGSLLVSIALSSMELRAHFLREECFGALLTLHYLFQWNHRMWFTNYCLGHSFYIIAYIVEKNVFSRIAILSLIWG